MGNSIKYTVENESNTLKKGDFRIGTGDVGKGPTSETGFYKATAPPSGGYRIYLYNTNVSGNIAYHTVANDSELISFTNKLTGQSYTTVNECLVYFAGQTDKLCVNRDYEPIVTDGLVLNLDAGFTPSYPTTGTTFYDVSGTNNGTLTNGPTFNSDNGGSIVYDGVDDYMRVPYNSNLSLVNNHTLETWFYPTGLGGAGGGGEGTLLRAGQQGDLQYCQFFNSSNFSVNYHWYDGNFSSRATSDNTVSFNNWFLFSAVKSSTNLKLYINGSELVNTTITNSTNNSFGNINIGNTRGNSFQKYNGRIAVTRIYNRALTATEILQNYNATKGRFGL